MKTKLVIAVQSHLSDSIMEMQSDPKLAKARILFVKRLVALMSDEITHMEDKELDQIWNTCYSMC